MSRIGVFICHCGENIGATVDCIKVAELAANMEGVAYAVDYKYMCSDPGQTLIKNAIKEYDLDGVVVGACSPRMHEPTFRRACAEAGLNPCLCEIANIREHCSWVHDKGEATTRKAVDIVRSLVEKVKRNCPLNPIQVPITKKSFGDRWRNSWYSSKSGYCQLWISGDFDRERSFYRRAYVTVVRNISDFRLLSMYLDSTYG